MQASCNSSTAISVASQGECASGKMNHDISHQKWPPEHFFFDMILISILCRSDFVVRWGIELICGEVCMRAITPLDMSLIAQCPHGLTHIRVRYHPGDMCGDPECGLVCQGGNQCLQTGTVCVTSPCCPAHACSSTINKSQLIVSTRGQYRGRLLIFSTRSLKILGIRY